MPDPVLQIICCSCILRRCCLNQLPLLNSLHSVSCTWTLRGEGACLHQGVLPPSFRDLGWAYALSSAARVLHSWSSDLRLHASSRHMASFHRGRWAGFSASFSRLEYVYISICLILEEEVSPLIRSKFFDMCSRILSLWAFKFDHFFFFLSFYLFNLRERAREAGRDNERERGTENPKQCGA